MNKEFQETVENREIQNLKSIKNLILIDLDDFIKYQDQFRNKTIKINNILNGYLESIKGYKFLPDKFTPYQIYIENRTRKNKSDLSNKTIEEIGELLGIPD